MAEKKQDSCIDSYFARFVDSGELLMPLHCTHWCVSTALISLTMVELVVIRLHSFANNMEYQEGTGLMESIKPTSSLSLSFWSNIDIISIKYV